WYVLRVCCAQKRPVIVYSDNTYWLFVNEDVFAQPASFCSTCYKAIIWTLVNSANVTPSKGGLLIKLVTHASRHFITYTITATPSRWAKLQQSMTHTVCVMNPWTRAEIHRAYITRSLPSAPGVSLSTINKTFTELGPISRLCFGTQELLLSHRPKLNAALDGLTLRYLEDMAPPTRDGMGLDAVADKIYTLRRWNVHVEPSKGDDMDIVPITPVVASTLAARMRTLRHEELVRLFVLYFGLPSMRIMAGDAFAAYCHVIFSTRIKLELVPIVRIGREAAAAVARTKRPMWY
ncbi:hypothetical protein PILCRDRAFT_76949, partial [Piloderma croceum F 1598]